MAKILFIGDIIGRPGRHALARVLPMWKEEYKPDAVIVNIENMAHGKGVTMTTFADVKDLEIDCFTTGNHVFDKGELSEAVFKKVDNVIRPANYPESLPGHGYYRFVKNGQSYLVINLNGRVFFDRLYEGQLKNPFFMLDELITQQQQKGDIIFVDFHAEATSEKIAMGWHADGKVTALVGTHTHVPTADARVLPEGTAYITDVGMSGPLNSIIGAKKEASLDMFLEKGRFAYEVADEGPVMVNGVLIETNNEGKAVSIEKLYTEVTL